MAHNSAVNTAVKLCCCFQLFIWVLLAGAKLVASHHHHCPLFCVCPGSIKMTWQDLMVGVQCGLLMFPINILIITIFRSIKPRIVPKSKKADPEKNLRPPIVNIPTVLRVRFMFIFVWWLLLIAEPACLRRFPNLVHVIVRVALASPLLLRTYRCSETVHCSCVI